MRKLANRGGWFRAVCLLTIALMCVIGMVQAAHAHADDSATSHHNCSICASAHAGANLAPVALAPVLATATLASLVIEITPIFRPVSARFIRPPPAV